MTSPLAGGSVPPLQGAQGLIAVTKQRILVVDDNRDSAESLALLLSMSGHETHTAHDGAAALAIAQRVVPDLVLLDLGLPGLSGYDVCRRIRAQPWADRLVLVALTGWGGEEDRRRSRDAGFHAHMLKPVEYDAIIRMVASVSV